MDRGWRVGTHTVTQPNGSLVALVGLLGAHGCAGPQHEPCAGHGDAAVTVRPNRLDTKPIDDGSQVPVFFAPQGGIFTEFDIKIEGTAKPDLEQVRLQIVDGSDVVIATQQYNGAGLPLSCLGDDSLEISNLAVGFDLSLDLDELDGKDAVLTVGIDTTDTPIEVDWSVVLRVTE